MEKTVQTKLSLPEVDDLQRGMQLRMKELNRSTATGTSPSFFDLNRINQLSVKLADLRAKFFS